MADFLSEKRKEIEDRLNELKPLVEEYQQLEQAAAALAGVDKSTPARATPRRSRRRAGARRGGRPRGSGTRSAQALELVSANPGITIRELADRMKIQANYLYRVLPSLEQDKRVVKRGQGYHPAG